MPAPGPPAGPGGFTMPGFLMTIEGPEGPGRRTSGTPGRTTEGPGTTFLTVGAGFGPGPGAGEGNGVGRLTGVGDGVGFGATFGAGPGPGVDGEGLAAGFPGAPFFPPGRRGSSSPGLRGGPTCACRALATNALRRTKSKVFMVWLGWKEPMGKELGRRKAVLHSITSADMT